MLTRKPSRGGDIMDRFVDESMAVNVLLLLCGIFYAVLCVFSIVTGLMSASGTKELNLLELSDRFMSRYTIRTN